MGRRQQTAKARIDDLGRALEKSHAREDRKDAQIATLEDKLVAMGHTKFHECFGMSPGEVGVLADWRNENDLAKRAKAEVTSRAAVAELRAAKLRLGLRLLSADLEISALQERVAYVVKHRDKLKRMFRDMRGERDTANYRLATLQARVEELEESLRSMLRVQEMLMPGIGYIAVQDYALLNDAPIAARKALSPKE